MHLLDGWTTVDEQRVGGVIFHPEPVFDGWIRAGRPAVGEDVGTDLREGDLEVHEVAVVLAAPRRLAQLFDRFMKRIQSFIEMAERGVELKRFRVTRHGQKPVRASSTVA